MKKKTALLSLSLLLLPFSVSCGKGETDSKVRLRKIQDLDSTIKINSEKELNDIMRYDECVLYVSLEGCHYCQQTKTELRSYIAKTNVIVYEVDRVVYASAYDDSSNQSGKYAFLYPKLDGFPAFFFYKDGKLVDSYLSSLSDEKETEDMFSEYTYESNLYCLNDIEYSTRDQSYSFVSSEADEKTKDEITLGFTDTKLKEAISSTKAVVLYTWRRCSDCKSYQEMVLDSFLKEYPDRKLYYYETDGFMQLKRSENEIGDYVLRLWSDFSVRYHLDTYPVIDRNNNRAGYVPSILSYSGNDYEFSVFSNFSSPARNSDGTLSFSSAYSEQVRLLTSKPKVKEGDNTSSQYQKALSELTEEALKVNAKENLSFLERVTR